MSALNAGGSTRSWRRLRAYVLTRDGGRCQVPADELQLAPAGVQLLPGSWWALVGPDDGRVPCLAPASHVDHVIARAAGGTDALPNLRAACAHHNLSRGAAAGDDTPLPAPRRQQNTRWDW